MNLNPLWFASGEGEWSGWVSFDLGKVSDDARFSEVILAHAVKYESARQRFLKYQNKVSLFGGPRRPDRPLENDVVLRLLSIWNISIASFDLPRLRRYLRRCAAEFDLVNTPLTDYRSPVMFFAAQSRKKSYWKELRRRLIVCLSPAGAKAKLARHLGVTRQAVSEWIRRENRAPSAEYALRLLEWVTAEEVKQSKQRQNAGRLSEARAVGKIRKSKLSWKGDGGEIRRGV
jgi:transcriptional regulator with XRE-family HTH domain